MSKTFDELLESVNPGDTVTGLLKVDLKTTHHQELQKARQDWLREEIVKLEGEKLGGLARPIFVGANAPERMRIHNRALQTIIDRYQSELDQTSPVYGFFTAPEEVKRPVYERALQKAQEEQNNI